VVYFQIFISFPSIKKKPNIIKCGIFSNFYIVSFNKKKPDLMKLKKMGLKFKKKIPNIIKCGFLYLLYFLSLLYIPFNKKKPNLMKLKKNFKAIFFLKKL